MKKLPSIKTLSKIFDQPKEARKILEMNKQELLDHPFNKQCIEQCYNTPIEHELRLNVLNKLGGFYGVEGAELPDGNWLTYLNSGDTYSLTIVYYNDNFYVSTWGDFYEKYI